MWHHISSIATSLISRSHRLVVRTPGSHPGNRSSTLRGITKVSRSSYMDGRFALESLISAAQFWYSIPLMA